MQIKKNEQLGMPFSTASARLKKQVLFSLVQKTQQDVCFRCKEKILTAEELSIDHKVDWLDGNPSLFWNVDNIAYSHRKCNKPRLEKMRKIGPNGKCWCAGCKNFLSPELFHKDSTRWNGVNWRCKNCQRKDRDNDTYRKKHAAYVRQRNKIKEVS